MHSSISELQAIIAAARAEKQLLFRGNYNLTEEFAKNRLLNERILFAEEQLYAAMAAQRQSSINHYEQSSSGV